MVLNLNPFFLLEDDPDAKIGKSQIRRASSLTFNSLKLAASLKNETMTPDTIKGVNLCMDQFRSLFGSCRVPTEERDFVQVDVESDHVAVLFRNQFYYFRALWPRDEEHQDQGKDGEVMVAVNEADITQILQSIVNDGKNMDLAASVEGAIGVLTTLPRKQWAKARYQLVNSSEANRSALEVIDSALFVLVLDDFYPEDVNEAASNMLHGTHVMREVEHDDTNEDVRQTGLLGGYQAGTCCNRWYDKLQIIVCSDGSAGINFEHSVIDGHTALRFASDVYAETVVTFAKSITKSIYTQGCPIPSMIDAKVLRAGIVNGNGSGKSLDTNPKKLTFDIVEKLKDRIFYAETSLGDACNGDDTFVLEFDQFGKNFIVANKMSPDSVVQMSIMLAYYRLYGEIVCAYEPVLSKRYFHGRTEAMRPTTMQAAELCKCWMNRLATKQEKLNALRESTKYHSQLVKEAAEGKGADRHLYALKCIAEKKGMPTPALFQSDAWRALNHTVLSTSNCGNPALRLFGFGPVVPDGFGIGYIIKDSRIQYSISSKHRQTKRFAHAIRQSMIEIGDLLEPMNAQSLSYHRAGFDAVGKPSVLSKPSKDDYAVEFADGWVDTYGDTIKTGDARPSPVRDSSASLVGVAKVSMRKSLVRADSSVGSQIQKK